MSAMEFHLSRSLLAQGFICSLNAKIQIKANAFGLTNYLYFSMNAFVTSILILLRKEDRRHKNTLVSFGRMRAEKEAQRDECGVLQSRAQHGGPGSERSWEVFLTESLSSSPAALLCFPNESSGVLTAWCLKYSGY